MNYADYKAERLLFKHLTTDQIAQWEHLRGFSVPSRDKRYKYWIRKRQQVVLAIDHLMRVRKSYCIRSYDDYYNLLPLPEADHALAVKLLIESNEMDFLAIARSHGFTSDTHLSEVVLFDRQWYGHRQPISRFVYAFIYVISTFIKECSNAVEARRLQNEA